MSWLRIDDHIHTHHKIVKAGPAASWLWICGIAHSQNHLTDGFIADGVIGYLGIPKHHAEALAKRLLRAGLWERVEGGFLVHDYLQHNASKQERQQVRSTKEQSGRIGGRRSGQVRRNKRDNTSKQTAKQTEADTRSTGKQTVEAKRTPLLSTPLHSVVLPPTAEARTEDRTNTAGREPEQPRRDTPDGGPSAPASGPVDPPMATTVEEAQAEYERDPRAYDLKYRRKL